MAHQSPSNRRQKERLASAVDVDAAGRDVERVSLMGEVGIRGQIDASRHTVWGHGQVDAAGCFESFGKLLGIGQRTQARQ